MNILALDSTEKTAAVAIVSNGKVVADFILNTGNTHSEHLLPMVEDALKFSGLTFDDIDLFACSSGPGSFTGVRIGVATIKGLAFGRNKPCVSVSALEAMAYSLSFFDGIICPVMDARRSQLYNALFISDGYNLSRITDDRSISSAELSEELKKYNKKIVFVGGGYDIIRKDTSDNKNVVDLPDRLIHESAVAVADLAEKKYNEGISVNDTDLRPYYLRPSQAERMKNGDNT